MLLDTEIEPGYLSTGDPSTLGSYLVLCRAFFGSNSNATKFIERKIEQSPNRDKEPVIADERQMVQMLGTLHLKEGPLDDILAPHSHDRVRTKSRRSRAPRRNGRANRPAADA